MRPSLLHRYQRDWMRDRSRFKIGMFARQCGKTFTTTLEIVDSCYEAATRGGRERWVILSRGERQAKEAMEEGVHLHAKAYGMAVEAMAHEVKLPDGTTCTAHECVLPGGSRITALPANPDTARGFAANVFLDEFAFHRDSRKIWGALFPVISAGHKLRIASTPNGKSNKFYELMSGDDRQWSRHEVDIHRAVADGLPRDIEEMREAMGDEELWKQEYELDWRDGASAWLSHDLISGVEHADAGTRDGWLGGPTTIGNDIARRHDLWVAWVLEHVGDVLWTREIVELRGATFEAQDATLDELVRHYGPYRIAMDQTGMGEKPVEDAKRRYGRHVVEGVLLTPPVRLDLATGLRRSFEDRRIRIPAGNRALRADLHSVKREAGPTGAPRLVVDDDGEAGSHADRFWAGALGKGAAASAGAQYGYRPVLPAEPAMRRGWRDRPDHSGDRRRPAGAFVGGSMRSRGAV